MRPLRQVRLTNRKLDTGARGAQCGWVALTRCRQSEAYRMGKRRQADLVDEDAELAQTRARITRVGDARDGRSSCRRFGLDTERLVAVAKRKKRNNENNHNVVLSDSNILVCDGVARDGDVRDSHVGADGSLLTTRGSEC